MLLRFLHNTSHTGDSGFGLPTKADRQDLRAEDVSFGPAGGRPAGLAQSRKMVVSGESSQKGSADLFGVGDWTET